MTDEGAREVLESILRMRADKDTAPFADVAAIQWAIGLLEGVAGWAIQQRAHSLEERQFAGLTAEEQRESIVRHLEFGIIPPGSAEPLARSLKDLDDGEVAPLVAPRKGQGRGGRGGTRIPSAQLGARLKLAQWVHFQASSGRTLEDLKSEVASQVFAGEGTRQAFDRMLVPVERQWGEGLVKRLTAEAKAAGVAKVTGKYVGGPEATLRAKLLIHEFDDPSPARFVRALKDTEKAGQ